MMISTCTTDLDPGKRLNELCWEWEKRPGLLDCTIFHGFPYTDVPAVGMTVVTIADGDAALAREAAQDVARAIWAAREGYRLRSLTPQEAIAEALAVDGGPVVINDTSDNPGGGSPGDSTHLLRAMLEARLPSACYAFIYDPQTAALAHDAGVGATVRVRLGGKTDTIHGTPIEADAYVKGLTDGRFRYTTPMGRGMAVNLGPMARLQIGGVDILVASERNQVLDDQVFLLNGIDVRAYKIVALKSSAHFRSGFNHLAKAIIAADAPGATTVRIGELHPPPHSSPNLAARCRCVLPRVAPKASDDRGARRGTCPGALACRGVATAAGSGVGVLTSEDAVGTAQGEGTDGGGGVDRTAGYEGRAITDVEVRHVPGLVIGVGDGGGRIAAHAAGTEQMPGRVRAGGATADQFGGPGSVGEFLRACHAEGDDPLVVGVQFPGDRDAGQAGRIGLRWIEFDSVGVDW